MPKLITTKILEIEVRVYENDDNLSFDEIKELIEYGGIHNINNSYTIRMCNHENPYVCERE